MTVTSIINQRAQATYSKASSDNNPATYILSDGHICIGSFKKKVDFVFTLKSNIPNLIFYRHPQITPISFSDDINGTKTFVPPLVDHHQFDQSINLDATKTVLNFTYHNDDHGTAGTNGQFRQSIYGFYIGDSTTGKYVGGTDPTIDNGGND
jgi:hypothetical protein